MRLVVVSSPFFLWLPMAKAMSVAQSLKLQNRCEVTEKEAAEEETEETETLPPPLPPAMPVKAVLWLWLSSP